MELQLEQKGRMMRTVNFLSISFFFLVSACSVQVDTEGLEGLGGLYGQIGDLTDSINRLNDTLGQEDGDGEVVEDGDEEAEEEAESEEELEPEEESEEEPEEVEPGVTMGWLVNELWERSQGAYCHQWYDDIWACNDARTDTENCIFGWFQEWDIIDDESRICSPERELSNIHLLNLSTKYILGNKSRKIDYDDDLRCSDAGGKNVSIALDMGWIECDEDGRFYPSDPATPQFAEDFLDRVFDNPPPPSVSLSVLPVDNPVVTDRNFKISAFTIKNMGMQNIDFGEVTFKNRGDFDPAAFYYLDAQCDKPWGGFSRCYEDHGSVTCDIPAGELKRNETLACWLVAPYFFLPYDEIVGQTLAFEVVDFKAKEFDGFDVAEVTYPSSYQTLIIQPKEEDEED